MLQASSSTSSFSSSGRRTWCESSFSATTRSQDAVEAAGREERAEEGAEEKQDARDAAHSGRQGG